MLVAALIGPYFVDWNAYRAEMAREASRLVGAEVQILGDAEVRLLPTPTITLEGVRLGNEAESFATADRVAAEFDLPAMIRGEISVLALTVERPEVVLALGPDGALGRTLTVTHAGGVDPARVGLENVRITDGSLVFRRADAPERRFDDLDLTLGAPALTGPYTVDGSGRIGGIAAAIRLSTGLPDAEGAVRIISRVEPVETGIVVSVDGRARLADGIPSYAGTLTATRAAPATEGAAGAEGTVPERPSRLEGELAVTPAGAELSELNLTFGGAEQPTAVSGSAALAFAPETEFSADLELQQLDLDREFGGGAPAALFDRLAERLAALPPSPLPGRVRLEVPALLAGGEVLQGLLVDAETAADGWRVRTLSVAAPGRTTFSLSGTLVGGHDPGFDGRIALAAEQPGQLVAWWLGTAETAAAPAVTVDGMLVATSGGIAMRSLRIGSGDSAMTGDFGWRPAEGDAGSGLDLSLAGPVVDLDTLRSLAGLLGAATPAELARSFAGDVSLDLAGDRVTIAGYRGGRFRIAAQLSNGTLTVDRLEADNLAGATLSASGRIVDLTSTPAGRITAHLSAPDLTGAATVAADLMPQSGIGDYLLVAGPTLAPLDLTLDLETTAASSGIDATLALTGSAATTRVAGRLLFAGALDAWRDAEVTAEGSIANPEAGNLLAQSGIPLLPIPLGDARAAFRFTGRAAAGLDSSIEASVAGTRLDITGSLTAAQGAPLAAAGTARLASDDVRPLALASGRVFELGGAPLPVEVDAAFESLGSGFALKKVTGDLDGVSLGGNGALDFSGSRPRLTGEVALGGLDAAALLELGLGVGAFSPTGREQGPWPEQSFPPPPFGWLDITAEATAERLAVAGFDITGARFGLTQSAGGLRIENLTGALAGGRFEASATIANTDGSATLGLRTALAGADAAALAWRDDAGALVTGSLDATFDVETNGRSVAALVASASGSGTLRLAGAGFRGADPSAFTAATIAADGGLALDPATIAGVFEPSFAAGPLEFGDLAATATIGGGLLRLSGVAASTSSVTLRGGATLALTTGVLSSSWTLSAPAAADDPAGTAPSVDVSFSGPIAAPERSLDLSALTAQLTVRESIREAERVRALEEQVREEQRRAAEAARQRAEEARRRAEEEARRKAEEEARLKAEEEARLAAEEERRQAEAAAAREAAEAARRDEDEAARRRGITGAYPWGGVQPANPTPRGTAPFPIAP